ncbi:ABC transporter substrate-binding protein [Deinococcus arboris]|nr:ABC transporter substrate-binding protein [Deinococcus arboris]
MKPLLTLLAALAVSSASAQTFPLTIKHDLGTATLPAMPKRVIVLGEELTELTAVLGIKPVGFASGRIGEARLGQPLTNLTSPAGTSLGQPVYVGATDKPSMETILALKPDLILMWGEPDETPLYNSLRRLAPTLAWNYNRDAQLGWKTGLRETAKVFGKSAQANRYIQQYDARISALRARVAPRVEQAPRTAFLALFGPQTISVLGEQFAFSNVLRRLGMTIATPTGVDPSVYFKELSPEAVLTLSADRVLVLRVKAAGTLPVDALLKRRGLPVVTYPLDPQEPQSGPLTDLKRAEALAKLLATPR